MKAKPTKRKSPAIARASKSATGSNYHAWSGGIASLLEEARRQSARHVNAILTATYWEIGRRIVEFVQQGETRAEYGDEVLDRLSGDLTKKFGRGFSHDNLQRMRLFYLAWPVEKIYATLSRKSLELKIFQTASEKFLLPENSQTLSAETGKPIYATVSRKSEIDTELYLEALCHAFPLSWSHYVRLLSVEKPEARAFYETESLRGGWSVRQLDRQVSTLFYERTALANLTNKILAAQYKLALPAPRILEKEIEKTRRMLESRMKLGYNSVVRNGKLGKVFGRNK